MNLRDIREEAISAFFYRLPEYREKLQALGRWDNNLIKNKLKELLEKNCSLAVDYHLKRTGMED